MASTGQISTFTIHQSAASSRPPATLPMPQLMIVPAAVVGHAGENDAGRANSWLWQKEQEFLLAVGWADAAHSPGQRNGCTMSLR